MDDDRIAAILIPPQLEHFRAVCRVQGDLEANFSGWYKHVILTPDRVFLFPRNGEQVDQLEREADVLQVLEPCGLGFVPRLLGRWHDPQISPYPFIATSRLGGMPYDSIRSKLAPDQAASFMADVGRVIATWHNLDASQLPAFLQDDTDPLHGLLGRLTTEATLSAAIAEAESILANHLQGRPLARWEPSFRDLAQLPPVLVHGDICGNQFLVDEHLNVTGVVDWGRAHVGHPLRDFLFGEWSLEFFEWESSFALFRERMWQSYQAHRNIPLPGHEEAHALFTIADACWIVEQIASDPAPSAWLRRHYEQSLANLAAII